MKTIFISLALTFLLTKSFFGQEEFDKFPTVKHQSHSSTQSYPAGKISDDYPNTFQWDGNDIQISSPNPEDLNERQLTVIENIITDDFLVNDDSTLGVTHRYPTISIDSEGNFIIAWEDFRNGTSDIYLQRYNFHGIKQGTNIKVNDDSGNASQYSPSVAMDSEGNIVITWADFRNGWNNPDIYFQRYNSSGTAEGINTKANDDTITADQGDPAISVDSQGNFVIAWTQFWAGNSDIYYRRFDSNGLAQSSNKKVNDDIGVAGQYSPSIAMNLEGTFVDVWTDLRNGNAADIYFQLYNSNGLPEGSNRKSNDDPGRAAQHDPIVVIDSIGKFLITWADLRNGNSDIYFQRYNENGIKDSINIRVNDDTGTNTQFHPAISMDTLSNFVIVWSDYRDAIWNSNVIGQRYFENGSQNSGNYLIVADSPNHREEFPVVVVNNSNLIFSWMDNRISFASDIFAKVVDWDWNGITLVSDITIETLEQFLLFQNYPNPFNPTTKISWQSPVSSHQTLRVYDILGNEVATLINEYKPAGSYNVEFRIENLELSSGVYFYQLRAGDFIQTKKMILIK